MLEAGEDQRAVEAVEAEIRELDKIAVACRT